MAAMSQPRKVQTKLVHKSRADDASVLSELKGWCVIGEQGSARLTKCLQMSVGRKCNELQDITVMVSDGPFVAFKYMVVRTLSLKGRFAVVLRRASLENMIKFLNLCCCHIISIDLMKK